MGAKLQNIFQQTNFIFSIFVALFTSQPMKKRFALIALLLSLTAYNAQYTTYTLISAGYSYQKQSFADVGAKLLLIKKDDYGFRLGGYAIMGATNGKFVILPKAQADVIFNFRRNIDVFHSIYYIAGAESTTHYFAPYAGMSVMGLLDFTAGHGFAYGGKTLHGKELGGFQFGLKLSLPLEFFQ